MARYTGAKCRLCKREGKKLFLKGERCYSPKCPIEKKGVVPPGQHGQRRKKKLSDYGYQLREKQKAKRIYGILERQFKRYFELAAKKKGATGETLLQLLETRLDNFIFRLGLVPSKSVARQTVSHGHVTVNGKKVNISSYLVKPGETVTLSPKGLNLPLVKEMLETKAKPPAWIERKATVGKMIRLPKREEIDTDINEQLIVEYYSR